MTKLLVTKGFSVPHTACSQPEDWKGQFPRGVLWGRCHRTKEAPLLEHTCVGWTPTQVTMMPQAQNKRGSFRWGTSALSHSPPTGGTVTRSRPQPEQEQLLQRGRDVQISGLHPANQKLQEGLRPGFTHIEPSEHILADADEWQELASAQGPLPKARPRRLHGPRVGG